MPVANQAQPLPALAPAIAPPQPQVDAQDITQEAGLLIDESSSEGTDHDDEGSTGAHLSSEPVVDENEEENESQLAQESSPIPETPDAVENFENAVRTAVDDSVDAAVDAAHGVSPQELSVDG